MCLEMKEKISVTTSPIMTLVSTININVDFMTLNLAFAYFSITNRLKKYMQGDILLDLLYLSRQTY